MLDLARVITSQLAEDFSVSTSQIDERWCFVIGCNAADGRTFEIVTDGVELFESRLDGGESRVDFEYAEAGQRELLTRLTTLAMQYIRHGGQRQRGLFHVRTVVGNDREYGEFRKRLN